MSAWLYDNNHRVLNVKACFSSTTIQQQHVNIINNAFEIVHVHLHRTGCFTFNFMQVYIDISILFM